ncbi:MAG: tetratricopeptide repeat protein, partial [Gammaproteobacteria bacterium]|nr:tetratricopeptide repeat protein [Gammaproteobacteria bacterium]
PPPQAMRPRPPVPPQAMLQQPPQQAMLPRSMPQQAPSSPQVQTESAPTQADQRAAEVDAPISTRELWISAREEFHRGNLDASIRNYQKVIASSSDNFDAYGEMGNVYLRMGSPVEAANAYYEAAAILVKKGQLRRAGSLIPMLQRLDRTKAEELNQLLANSTPS